MYQVLKYVNENLCEQFNLNEISKRFGYSKWYFCERFKQYTGLTFTAYVRHRRMQLAAAEIAGGGRITDIAVRYGYETPVGFSKAFLTEFSCMPSEFKQDEKRYRNLYEERRTRMLPVSDRCVSLRQSAMNEKPYNDFLRAQREYYYVRGAAGAARGSSNNERVAAGITSVIRNFPVLIADGELLVGHNYADPEFFAYQDGQMEKWLEEGGFSREQIAGFFQDKAGLERDYTQLQPRPNDEQGRILEEDMAAMGYCICDNHTVIDYEKVLKLGFEEIGRQARQMLTPQTRDFYEPVIAICDAACTLGRRYAQKAREQLEKETPGGSRARELALIADTCEQVPQGPARSFMEAAQSLLFAHIINTWEDGINANSLGRLDQILYPYYRADIDRGVMTRTEAFEVLCCLWIKLYRDYDVQQSCVGGCDSQGNCAVNELSYLMLDATEQLDFIRCLSVRFDENTDKAFITRALKVVGHVQKGVPFFFNDSVMIPALTAHGINLQDARNYTQIGCVETVIPGKSNPHAVTARANLLKAMEYALNNGYSSMLRGVRPGLATGDFRGFTSYESLREAVFAQMELLIEQACVMTLRTLDSAAHNRPKPYKSMLTEGCFDRAVDFNDAGAVYDYYQVMLLGIPNLADSLEAVHQLVYKEKRYTLEQLVHQLENDYPDEAVRLDFVNKAPKFGNDIDEVDDLAAQIMDFSCDVLSRLSRQYGRSFHAQPFTFLWMLDHGRMTGATPDGRRKGEILAYSVSPMQGRDFNGFTALTNSLSKLPTKKAPGTTSAILEVDPQLFTNKNITYFADILLAAAQKGLCNVQFNVVDADTLLDAQKHPEKHRNLAVRVSGFSQRFYLLDKNLQDHIIARTKHKYM